MFEIAVALGRWGNSTTFGISISGSRSFSVASAKLWTMDTREM